MTDDPTLILGVFQNLLVWRLMFYYREAFLGFQWHSPQQLLHVLSFAETEKVRLNSGGIRSY